MSGAAPRQSLSGSAFNGSVPPSIQREVMFRLDAPLMSEVRFFARRYSVPLEALSEPGSG
jgi:hypothetical protein